MLSEFEISRTIFAACAIYSVHLVHVQIDSKAITRSIQKLA